MWCTDILQNYTDLAYFIAQRRPESKGLLQSGLCKKVGIDYYSGCPGMRSSLIPCPQNGQ